MNFYEQVYEKVKLIPMGKVSTYGRIAMMCGVPRGARAVGNALHHNPYPGVVPCHRVVNSCGKLAKAFAFGGIEAKKKLLQSEGVEVANDAVDLKKYLWSE